MTQNSDVILARMMALHPKIIDLTLDRMWRLLNALGNPERRLPPVIHIAGTNGKGSTQAMIRAGLEAQGKRVHAYTSPHLARFQERIRLAGDLISDDALTEALDRCYAANNGENITYFEITTCAAILAFSETPADYTLLEVGLGGRLDATNVIDPVLSIITPVDLDHQQFLGDTLPLIAAEKAGIIKRGVPCIVGPQQDDAMDVIEAAAARLGAHLIAYGQHFHVRQEHERLVFEDETGLLDLPLPALPGPHQVQNAGAVLAALRYLGADETAASAAVTQARWPARMERLTKGPLVDRAAPAELWLDGGHNPAAAHAIAATLDTLPKRETHLICGMLNTKDVAGFMQPLAPYATSLVAVAISGETNTLPAETTAEAATAAGISAHSAPDVYAALDAITAKTPNARILICGSLYFAGHVMRENE
jgi:dihydrofolate synthase/folylpolyglutamate synthase